MLNYLPDYGKLYRGPDWSLDPMSTAIARIYTPEGFVIAADGRECMGDQILREDAQKIFKAEYARGCLAYSLGGTSRLHQIDEPETVLFDFVEAATEVFRELSSRDLPKSDDEALDGDWLLSRLIRNSMRPRIMEAKQQRAGRLNSDSPLRDHRSYIFMDGYYDGNPFSARVVFHHHGAEGNETAAKVLTDDLDDIYQFGAAKVLIRLDTETDMFSEFRPTKYRGVRTLQEAIRVADNRIQAQCSPIARKIDPISSTMGGFSHIASVTRDGFTWVKAPKQA
jgi:hypothetical protein